MRADHLDEISRLQALRQLAILDTECEEAFDELTKSAALVCQVPIALISLIDEHRQWFKSRVGLDACETPRNVAFCDHAIRQPRQLMEINDATKDTRFANNPLVIGPPAIRFYAGMPLVDKNGFGLGTLCVIDTRPRTLEPWQREVLGLLAQQVNRLFAARLVARDHTSDSSSQLRAVVSTQVAAKVAGAEERFRVLFEYSSDAHLLFDDQGIIDCNQAAIAMLRCRDKNQVLCLHPARLSPEFQPDGRRSDEKCIEMDRLAHENGYHRFEWQHRRLDGTDFPVEVTLTPVILSEKSVLLVVWHDLTERKRIEQLGREREQRWLLALESTGDGLWDWDLESNRVFFSTGWKRMLGYQEHDIGDTLDEWEKRIHFEDKERTEADLKRHLSGEVAHYQNEHRALCRDGTWKWILDRGMVVERYSDGRPKRMVGTHTDLTERRRVEDTLRLQQERFRAVSDASPAGIFVTDNTGQATYLNDRWCSLAGISEAEGLGTGWAEALHPDDKAPTFEAWNKAVGQSGQFTNKHRFLHRNGRVVWGQVMAAPMQMNGQIVGYVGTVLDITDSQANQQQLIDTLRRFDLVAKGADIGIWETFFDPLRWKDQINNELPFYWSPNLIRLLGYQPNEFPPFLEPWLKILHPDDRSRTLLAVNQCLELGVPYNVEYRLYHNSGEYRWYHATGQVEHDAQGRPIRFAGSLFDISRRKRDEAQLERARIQLLYAIEAIDAGFAMFDAKDQLVISNQRFASFYNLDESIFTAPITYLDIIKNMRKKGIVSEEIESLLINRHRKGPTDELVEQEYRLAGRWVRIQERHTADGGMVSLHTDVTTLKDIAEDMRVARDLAQVAAKTKADFLATMSHELRTPMNGVIGMTSLLLGTPLDNEQKEYAETARTCSDQLLTLINDILDFSKIEAGSLKLENISFSPRHLAEESVALLADQAEKKGLQMLCLIGADVPSRLFGDPTRLRQIIINLLSNAAKFTERGEIVLSISLYDQDTIDISVRDTGIGISPEASRKLFQAFVQADSSTTRKYGGTGLGLVICQRLVQLMGGTITLESELNQGSTFTCRLPLLKAADEHEKLEHQSLVGCHALVIASSATIRRSLREQLISWGMSCDEASDDAAIPAALARRSPALIVMDHQVTDSSLPIAQKITPSLKNAGIPLILLVGGAQRGMANAAKEAGFSGFLTKPIRQAHLFECLLLVLNQTCSVSDRPQVKTLVTRHTLDEERKGGRILLVEDNPVNRQVAVAMLGKLGCRCDIATNGQEGVDAMLKHEYKIVFMDCQMPIMDGYEAVKIIRLREAEQKNKSNHVHIIALTANAMQGDRERCLAAGMDDYLTKPITVTALESALKRATQRHFAVESPEKIIISPPVTVLSSDIIDDAAMQGLLNATDMETVRSVVELIRAEAVSIVVELSEALNRDDAIGLGRSAHRFKGAVGTLGLRRVYRVCEQLERQGRGRELSGVAELIQELKSVLAEALPVLVNHPLIKS